MNFERLAKLKEQLTNPILIKKKENLLYLTGRSFDCRAEEYLLVTKKNVVGFGSGLEKMDWVKKVDRLKNIGKYLKGFQSLDIEYGFTYGEGDYIQLKVKSEKLKVGPRRSPVDEMRQIKGADEIEKVRKSMQIVERVFEQVKQKLRRREGSRPFPTELELADFIRTTGLKFGAQDVSFPAIVASGANAAVPHHVPSAKRLKPGESIIMDFGFKYKNYCSDFTRTVFLKKVGSKKIEEAYNQAEKAYNESINFCNLFVDKSTSPLKRGEGSANTSQNRGAPLFLKEGVGGVLTGNDVYQKAVNILAEKHLDKYFIHSLGHGTGLEIHELPNLSPNSKDVLQNGMVFSIEPGVYIPKLGGIRIEDLVYLPRSDSQNESAIQGLEQGKVKKFINVSTKLMDNIL